MTSRTLLVIGASGLVGGRLLLEADDRPGWTAVPVTSSEPPAGDLRAWLQADVTDPESLERLFDAARPDCVVNLSCLPVGLCEREPEQAHEVQVLGARHVARLCGPTTRLVHLSTDMVYSGNKGSPYTPNDTPDPISAYGRTKRLGEEEALAAAGNCVVLRSALVLGIPVYKPGGFLDWMAVSVLAGKTIPLFTDQFRTPIAVVDLARAILCLADSSFRGVLHAGGDRRVNRTAMGERLLTALGAAPALIRPIPMNEFKSDVPLQRDLSLDNSAFKREAGLAGLTDIFTLLDKTAISYRRTA